VGASGFGHTAKAVRPVADDRVGWIEVPPRERGDRLARETLDPAELHADWLAFGRRLDRGDEWRFSRRAAATFGASSLAADVGIVDRDTSGELFRRVPLHHDLFKPGLTFQAVFCVTSRRRPSSMLDIPCLVWVI
jgi:hypothetical protein